MEDVIVFLLFAYLFVLRPILKRLRAARPDAGPSPDASPERWLEALRRRLREVAEQASTRPTGRRPGEDQLVEEEFISESDASSLTEGPSAKAGVPESREAQTRTAGGDQTPEREVPERPGAPAEPVSQPQAAADAEVRAAPGRVNLKQAVIWSEILGPPVSLRDS